MANSSAQGVAVDTRNSAFWNELCGSTLAKSLGITDNSAKSLKKFDDWYFDFYDYLFEHVPFANVSGKRVLEIGLGYGTVAQRLMASGALYHGIDIAKGPVAMAMHRAALLGVDANIQQGSALTIPFGNGHFDCIVTIGCLHHTGDLAGALREVHRCLRLGGTAIVMVYSALSYRQWTTNPSATWRRRQSPRFDWTNADPALRRAYDANLEGSAAPETTFITPREAAEFLKGLFQTVKITPRNIGRDFLPAYFMPRRLANALFAPSLGLDLYIECVK